MEWEAWYTERRRYASPGWAPDELPGDGCLGIVKWLEKRHPVIWDRQILSGDRHYFFWEGEWFSNSDSREEIERRYPGVEVIVKGKWTLTSAMKRVQAEMAEAKEPPSCRP